MYLWHVTVTWAIILDSSEHCLSENCELIPAGDTTLHPLDWLKWNDRSHQVLAMFRESGTLSTACGTEKWQNYLKAIWQILIQLNQSNCFIISLLFPTTNKNMSTERVNENEQQIWTSLWWIVLFIVATVILPVLFQNRAAPPKEADSLNPFRRNVAVLWHI